MCAKWVDGATLHPFPSDDPTPANAHAAPTHLALLLPCGVLRCRPVGCLPAAETAFPSDMLSSVSFLFGEMMHCDACLSLPRSGSSLWLLSRLRLPSAPVCSADVACCYSFGLPAAEQPFRQIPLRTYSCSTAVITPTRQYGNPPLSSMVFTHATWIAQRCPVWSR
jgi:hypothetical protein